MNSEPPRTRGGVGGVISSATLWNWYETRGSISVLQKAFFYYSASVPARVLYSRAGTLAQYKMQNWDAPETRFV